jgi:hypothetical protein
LTLLGLTGFAISQPLLSLLGDNPTFVAFYGVDGAWLVWFAIAIAFGPPLVVWAAGLAAGAVNTRLGRWCYLASVGALLALAIVQLAKRAGLERPALVILAAAGGAAAGLVAYLRFDSVVTWGRLTAVLPFVALAVFLFGSASSDLLRSAGDIELVAAGRDLPPVVFMVLDELPTKSLVDDRGQIDAVRFPNLAAFAQDATWYRHFTTVAPFTDQAVPVLLTGRDPKGGAPLWTNHPDNLFTLLAPTHQLNVFESFTRLCGLDRCDASAGGTRPRGRRLGDLFGETTRVWRERVSPRADDVQLLDDFAEDVDEQLPPPELVEGTGLAGVRRAERGVERVREFVATLEPTSPPTFSFLHVMLPHSPFRAYPDGRLYEMPLFGPATYPGSTSNAVPWLSALTEQRHLMQAQYTDRLVGQVLRRLQATDLYDDALVVVVADHGVSYETGTSTRELEESSVDSVAYAPLLVKAPGQARGRVDDSNVMSVDLVPTIADLLGVRVDWEVDGVPVGSEAMRARGRAKYFYDYTNALAPELERVYRFDDGALPRARDRWIPRIGPDDDPLAGLTGRLDLDGVLGRRLDDLVPRRGGRAEVHRLGELRDPPDDTVPPGVVYGNVVEGPSEGTVVVAIDGTVVAGSPRFEQDGRPGTFAALLPAESLRGRGNDVRIAIVDDDDVVELDLTEQ